LRRRHPLLAIDPEASSNVALARFSLARSAALSIGPGFATERLRFALHFALGEGAHVELGARCWLRTELDPVRIVAGPGAVIRIGDDSLLNGCHISAKQAVTLGRRVFVGYGSRILDADQHDFDAEHPERCAPVEIGDHAWIASDVTVLRGVRIGAHAVIGARSVVTRDIPDHTLAFGNPAVPRGKVGDRSRTR
jgi:acetyltransferase-like isoleucine patch superfamily enzyme